MDSFCENSRKKSRQRKEDFFLKDSYQFGELVDLLDFLRSPEGCPWDREQSHQSIQSSLIEEAWEVIDALACGDPLKFKDELGDVLLQVVFHAQIAKESGDFCIDDVVTNICRKLISRHTHIFGEDEADNPVDVLSTWEANKKEEKGLRSESDVLRDVPKRFPALIRAFKIQKKAANVGFDWPTVQGAEEKIKEETEELLALVHRQSDGLTAEREERILEEAGDLLFAVVNTLRHLKIDPELALHKANEKFIRRFSAVEEKATGVGKKLQEMSLEEMDALWEEAKKEEKAGNRK